MVADIFLHEFNEILIGQVAFGDRDDTSGDAEK